jgi:hypothetical protein
MAASTPPVPQGTLAVYASPPFRDDRYSFGD